MPAKRGSSELVFLNHWPAKLAVFGADSSRTLLIYDRRLAELPVGLRKSLRGFPLRYPVNSGEGLKDLARFSGHAKKLARLVRDVAPRELTVLAVGGGSVGDFAGFFASIYKRGVRLVHVPSTWLAAIDSSHGGKTALNLEGAKNQFGTFYPAARVVMIRELLAQQPRARILDAMGELAKIALIDGGPWTRHLERSRLSGEALLWAFLRPAINSKMKIVAKDPYERHGLRQVLNLGHTTGHVFEAAFGWSHGHAVGQGLFFALDFAFNRGDISVAQLGRARALLIDVLGLEPRVKKLAAARFKDLLAQDKKMNDRARVTFLLPKGMGRVVREAIPTDEILTEARRQGWIS